MPFTPSHAVVALPFVRTPLVPAAIAIGAMTPDLPLFVRGVGLRYSFTHTPGHMLWTTLIALGLFLLWRVLLRPAVAEVSPRALRARLPREWGMAPGAALRDAFGAGRPMAMVLLLVSLVLGVASHIAWDAFTHVGRWGVDAVPLLAASWGPLPGYKWLQYASGVLGVAVIAVWLLLWLRRRMPHEHGPRLLPVAWAWAWAAALPVLLVGALILGYRQRGPFTAEFTPQHLAYAVLPPACGIWAVLTVALGVVVLILRIRRPGH